MSNGKAMAYAENADGLSIAFDVEGAGEPIILIAGMSADWGLWDHVRPALNERYRTIAFDNRDA